VEQVVPTLRRDCNYTDLERVRSQSDWDELNERWRVPPFTVEKNRRITLPPATHLGPGSVLSPARSASSFSDDVEFERQSEERLIERLSESALRDPAAAYFRRAATADPRDVPSLLTAVGGGRSSRNAAREAAAATPAVPLSPLLRRPRHL